MKEEASAVVHEDQPEMRQRRDKLLEKYPDLDRVIDDWKQYAYEFEEAQLRMSRILTDYSELDALIRDYIGKLDEISNVDTAYTELLTRVLDLPDLGANPPSIELEPPLPGVGLDPLEEFNKEIRKPLEEEEEEE